MTWRDIKQNIVFFVLHHSDVEINGLSIKMSETERRVILYFVS